MKRILLPVIFIFLLAATGTFAQEQISSAEAKDNIGKTLQVKGKVASVFISEKGNKFISFDGKSPNQTFTAAIFSKNDIDISRIKEGCTLTVYGEIKEYKGKPEIVIESSEQIISIEE